MPVPYYLPPDGLDTRPTCQPERWGQCVEPYLPERTRNAPAANAQQRTASVVSSQIFPIILQATSVGSDTVFAISNNIAMPYILRGVAPLTNAIAGAGTTRFLARLRTTNRSTADANGFNAGQALLSPFADEEDLAIIGGNMIGPLWIPVDLGPHRLIARFVNSVAVAGEPSLVALITPQSDLDFVFPLPSDPAPVQTGSPFSVSQIGYNAPFLSADGTLEYRPEGFIPFTGRGESGYE